MVPAGNKAKHLSSVNHTTKTIHHHRHHHHYQKETSIQWREKIMICNDRVFNIGLNVTSNMDYLYIYHYQECWKQLWQIILLKRLIYLSLFVFSFIKKHFFDLLYLASNLFSKKISFWTPLLLISNFSFYLHNFLEVHTYHLVKLGRKIHKELTHISIIHFNEIISIYR